MSIPTDGYVPRHVDYNPQRKSSAAPIVIIFLVFLIAVTAAIYGGFTLFKSASKVSGSAEKSAAVFLTLFQEHKFAEAHAMMLPQAREVTPTSAMRDIFEAIEKGRGKLISWGKPQWSMQNFNGVTYVSLMYPLTYENGQSTVTIQLQEVNKVKWAIRNFNFQF